MARRGAVHEMVYSKKAPKPIGPYSQAVLIKQPGPMLYVSGQIPIEVPKGNVFLGDIKRQTEIAMTHVKNICENAGFALDEIVKCTIYLTDMGNFAAVNEIYQSFFVGQNAPARAVVEVSALPKEVGVEIEAIAMKVGKGVESLFEDLDLKGSKAKR